MGVCCHTRSGFCGPIMRPKNIACAVSHLLQVVRPLALLLMIAHKGQAISTNHDCSQCYYLIHVVGAGVAGVAVAVVAITIMLVCSWRRNWTFPCHDAGNVEQPARSLAQTGQAGSSDKQQNTAAARHGIPTVVPGRVKTKEELITERTQGPAAASSVSVELGMEAVREADQGASSQAAITSRSMSSERDQPPPTYNGATSASGQSDYEEPYVALQTSEAGLLSPYTGLIHHQPSTNSKTDKKELFNPY